MEDLSLILTIIAILIFVCVLRCVFKVTKCDKAEGKGVDEKKIHKKIKKKKSEIMKLISKLSQKKLHPSELKNMNNEPTETAKLHEDDAPFNPDPSSVMHRSLSIANKINTATLDKDVSDNDKYDEGGSYGRPQFY